MSVRSPCRCRHRLRPRQVALDDGDDVRRAIVVGNDPSGASRAIGPASATSSLAVQASWNLVNVKVISPVSSLAITARGSTGTADGTEKGSRAPQARPAPRAHQQAPRRRFVGVLRLGRLRVLAGLGDPAARRPRSARGRPTRSARPRTPRRRPTRRRTPTPGPRGSPGAPPTRSPRREPRPEPRPDRRHRRPHEHRDAGPRPPRAGSTPSARRRKRRPLPGCGAMRWTLSRAVRVTALLVAARQQLSNSELSSLIIPFRTGCRRVDAKSPSPRHRQISCSANAHLLASATRAPATIWWSDSN